MKRPDTAITIQDGYVLEGDHSWIIWDDESGEVGWHTCAEHVETGAVFAILVDDRPDDECSDIFAVFLGVREGRESLADADVDRFGKIALATYDEYSTGLVPKPPSVN